jgi:two-component system, NtrC family, sensor kinase
MMGKVYNFIGHLNQMTGNSKGSLEFLHWSMQMVKESGEHEETSYFVYFQLAFDMLQSDRKDSALFYLNKGKEFLPIIKSTREPVAWLIAGNIYYSTGQIDSADKYFRDGLKISEENNSLFLNAIFYNVVGGIFFERNMFDSCIYYKRKSLLLSRKYKYKLFEMESSGSLAEVYRGVNADSSLKYLYIMLAAKDEIWSDSRLRQFQQISLQDEKKQRDIEEAKNRLKNQIKMYVLIAAAGIILIIAFIFWRNSKQRKKANLLLKQQKDKVELTLTELRSTQAQLIQSEKMASLGELTVGIAHEIQNPLNFMNNFSDLNRELVDELQQELKSGKIESAISISNDIKENEEKINHHGNRVDAIVKGMLQHSRISSGVKEQTNINALCDEYLKFAYHGFRAKDKSFSAKVNTNFDESVGAIKAIPQDIGRVILNLINNAFYAVDEKKNHALSSSALNGYEPTVSLSTIRDKNMVEVRVEDNGNGIPLKLLDKIFQPFFTTKPTGQGTGLGLSLSYDIVKAHGGEVKVETKEGEGSVFIIILPAIL